MMDGGKHRPGWLQATRAHDDSKERQACMQPPVTYWQPAPAHGLQIDEGAHAGVQGGGSGPPMSSLWE